MLRRSCFPVMVGMVVFAQSARADIAPPPPPVGPPYIIVFMIAFLAALGARVTLLLLRSENKSSSRSSIEGHVEEVASSQTIEEQPSPDS